VNRQREESGGGLLVRALGFVVVACACLRKEQRDREDWEGSSLCCCSGRRKGITGLLLGIWRKEIRIAAALLGFQFLLLVLVGITGDRKAASCYALRCKIRAASLLFACRLEREQSGCCCTLDLATGENKGKRA
jgi:hypothetical protein